MQLQMVRNRFLAPAIFGALALFALVSVVAFAVMARADTLPTVTTTINNGSNSVVTSGPIGGLVHAVVVIASSTASTSPSGTVDFSLYNNTSCSGTPSTQAGVVLATTSLASSTASSATTTIPATGLSYKVHYNGDQNNPANDGQCMALTPTSSNISVATTLSTTTAQAGTLVHDSAMLSGATSNASGTVAYTVYINPLCTLNPVSAGTVNVTNAVVPNSNNILFNTAGTYYWQAVYSGDTQNGGTTSTCQNGQLVITATTTPPVASTTGMIVVDKVTNPSGNGTSFHFNTTGSGYGAFNLTDAATPNSQTLAAGTYSIGEQSMSGWTLTSAMCSRNNGSLNSYAPGANFTLNAGDTVRCTFTNTLNATTTPPNDDPGHHGDKDHDKGDHNNDGHPDNGHGNGNNGVGQFVRDLNQRIHDRLDNALRAHGLR